MGKPVKRKAMKGKKMVNWEVYINGKPTKGKTSNGENILWRKLEKKGETSTG